MSRMIGIMDLTRNYHCSKVSLDWIVEEVGLGNLAAAGDREENASHHFLETQLRAQECTGPPLLHVARYHRYLPDGQALSRSYRQRRRKSRTSIRHEQKCSGPTGWQSQLRGYYSSSLSSTVLALRVIVTLRVQAYSACSTSHVWSEARLFHFGRIITLRAEAS